ncbi:MAG: serine hydrolase [Chromatiales bacterium]|nr:serine hydrolase [Chromatiales bacterium]
MDSAQLHGLARYLRKEGNDVRAMLVARNGAVVFEWYSAGSSREHNHNVYSVTKSVVGTVTGIVIDQGKVASVEVRAGDVFAPGTTSTAVAGVSVADLLTMRSGLARSQARSPDKQAMALFRRLLRAEDRSAVVRQLDSQGVNGQTFAYGSTDPELLGAIIEKTTGHRLKKLTKLTLFDPLDFKGWRWAFSDDEGRVPASFGLRLRAVDMLKLGELFRLKGQWQGRSVVSRPWVEASTQNHTGNGYGYLWWTFPRNADARSFAAIGANGQVIHVMPDRHLVFVMASHLKKPTIKKLWRTALQKYVLPALSDDKPLPENAASNELLTAELLAAQHFEPKGRGKLNANQLPELLP